MKKHLIFACIIFFVNAFNVWADLPATEKLKGLRNAIDLKLYNKQIRNGGGKCLKIVGDEVKLFNCKDEGEQRFLIHEEQIKNINRKCLNVAGPDLKKNGGRVQCVECNESPNQKWRFDKGRLINGGGKCLGVAGPDLKKDGATVKVWDCNSTPNQQWKAVEIK